MQPRYGPNEWFTGWFPAITGKPAGAQIRAGAIAPKIERKQLALVRAAGTTQTTGNVSARIINPSRRLTCTFGIDFEPDSVVTIASFNASSVWTPRGAVIEAGREVLLHALESNIALPRMYEMDSMLPAVVIAATLGIPTDGAAATVPGTWILRVAWEPNQPICDDEITSLYAGCAADCVPLANPLVP